VELILRKKFLLKTSDVFIYWKDVIEKTNQSPSNSYLQSLDPITKEYLKKVNTKTTNNGIMELLMSINDDKKQNIFSNCAPTCKNKYFFYR